MQHVLLLNADGAPIRIVAWTTAVELLLEGKAVAAESVPGRFVRSPSLVLPWPSVVTLRRYSTQKGRTKYSGRNVLARDVWTCQYCGVFPRRDDGRPDAGALTVDHVIPKARARRGADGQPMVYLGWFRRWVPQTCWLNATTACHRCNAHKADRSPEQAGMTLRTIPREPTRDDVARMSISRIREVPPAWQSFLPASWHAAFGLGEPEAVAVPGL